MMRDIIHFLLNWIFIAASVVILIGILILFYGAITVAYTAGGVVAAAIAIFILPILLLVACLMVHVILE